MGNSPSTGQDALVEALRETIAIQETVISSKDSALRDKNALIACKDEQLTAALAGEQRALANEQKALAGEQRALANEQKAVESERMMRQINSSLTAAQEMQLAMLAKYYVPPVNQIELELKRTSTAGKWEVEPFTIENSESVEHKNTTWMLALVVDDEGSDSDAHTILTKEEYVVVRLINRNDKKICATVKFELLGLKKELDGLFDGLERYQDVELMPAEKFNQKTQDLISIKVSLQMDIHRIYDTTK